MGAHGNHAGKPSWMKKFICWFLIILGTINISYFFFGLGWGVYFGSLFLLLAGLLMVFYGILRLGNFHFFSASRFKILKRLAGILLLALLVSFIVIETLIVQSAVTEDTRKVDYILILGASLYGEELSLELRERLDKGLEYIKRNPGIKIIVSGGQGRGESITEAEAMRRYLVQHGAGNGNIIKEDKSTSTFENLKYSKEILQGIDRRENIKIMIVSNDFHLFRAKFLANRLGLEAYGLPAGTPLYIIPNHYVREYFAILKSFVIDRI